VSSRLISEAELLVTIEYSQLYIYGHNPYDDPPAHPDDARLRCEVSRIVAAIAAGTDQPAPENNGAVISSIWPESPAWTREHEEYFERQSQSDSQSAVARALTNAYELKIGIGVAGGVIDLLAVTRWIEDASLRIQVWSTEPDAGYPGWDHVVEADLDITEEKVYFEAPTISEVHEYPLRNDRYRLRIARTEHRRDDEEPRESYQLQFWPRTQDSAPQVIKRSPTIAQRF
jgi:hypothetical protein